MATRVVNRAAVEGAVKGPVGKTFGTVSVIGAAGHVGLGLSLVLADSGYRVFGIDIDEKANKGIMKGVVPFQEKGAEQILHKVLEKKTLRMTTDNSFVAQSDVVVIILGTPIDPGLNPDLEPLMRALASVVQHLRPGQLIVLRSTVKPGTTQAVKECLEQLTPYRVGRDLFLVYAPERVIQGQALREIPVLPQIIGAFDDASYAKACQFFGGFVKAQFPSLTPIEAEIAKLICNMYRYVNFALANEFYMIAEDFGANIHRVIDACNYNYPRMNLPQPGPNVSGPCLFKDGFFLVERFFLPDLIYTAFKINEGMSAQIVKKLQQRSGIRKVGILGLTFKAGSDDTRNSVSFKLKKLLRSANYNVVTVDPHLRDQQDFHVLRGCDCVILMTPHGEFRDLRHLLDLVDNDECLFVDIWGFWKEMRGRSENGYFGARQARVCCDGSSTVQENNACSFSDK